jgi:hypothetical protein
MNRGRSSIGLRHLTSCAALVVTSALCPDPADAQELDEEQTRITTRSDVQLRLESAPGTSGSRLAALGAALGRAVGDLKACYADVIKERPTVEGEMTLAVRLPKRGAPRVTVERDEPEDRELTRCVKGTVSGLEYDEVERPAGADATLMFHNSAAEGARRTQVRKRGHRIEVERDEEGHPFTTGGTPDGRVRFQVRGGSEAPDERLRAVHSGIRAAIPAILDCRRRATRRGQSPVGTTRVAVRVSRRGRAATHPGRTTVEAGPGVARCLARALGRHRFDRAARGTSRVSIEFGPSASDRPSQDGSGSQNERSQGAHGSP